MLPKRRNPARKEPRMGTVVVKPLHPPVFLLPIRHTWWDGEKARLSLKAFMMEGAMLFGSKHRIDGFLLRD